LKNPKTNIDPKNTIEYESEFEGVTTFISNRSKLIMNAEIARLSDNEISAPKYARSFPFPLEVKPNRKIKGRPISITDTMKLISTLMISNDPRVKSIKILRINANIELSNLCVPAPDQALK